MPPSFQTVTEYLSWDHDRLDAILSEVCAMVERGELAEAPICFGPFHDGLARHIRLEEEVLFPLFERKTGIVQGPTLVMRTEHRSILSALGTMKASLAAGDARGFRDGFARLHAVLPAHNDKEEQILYPMTDDALSVEERVDIAARLERAP